MNNPDNNSDNVDFTKLPLEECLTHKLWKARHYGYQELTKKFNNAISVDRDIQHYWSDPQLFNKFILDTNVIAQEQALVALEALLQLMRPVTKDLGNKSWKYSSVWVPSLVEKGLSSSRAHTKATALNCIQLLTSLDISIENTVQLMLPSLDKRLPKLLASVLDAVSTLILKFSLFNIENVPQFLQQILGYLSKLAGHADKSVRANALRLILNMFIMVKRDDEYRIFIDEFLVNNLKPIQQRELRAMIAEHDNDGDIDTTDYSVRFEKYRREMELARLQAAAAAAAANNGGANSDGMLDQDGDSVMGDARNGPSSAGGISHQTKEKVDPFTLLPEETILDKFPADFYDRVKSAKWKDRVEALEEYYNLVLIKAKRITKRDDYTTLLNTYSQIVSKDVNLQAVALAAQSIHQIFDKLRKPGLSKAYVLCVFPGLLQRTKEKKQHVIESIRNCLYLVCFKFYNPLSVNNDDMLDEILLSMRSRIPQVRLETAQLLTRVIKENGSSITPNDRNYLLKRLNEDNTGITPTVVKLVNDTLPNVRHAAFECMANLINLLGQRYFNDALEHMENIKRTSIEGILKKLEPVLSGGDVDSAQSSSKVVMAGTNSLGAIPSLNIAKKTIPSKRVATSPLRNDILRTKQSNTPAIGSSETLDGLRSTPSVPVATKTPARATTSLTRPATFSGGNLYRADVNHKGDLSGRLSKLDESLHLATSTKSSSASSAIPPSPSSLRNPVTTLPPTQISTTPQTTRPAAAEISSKPERDPKLLQELTRLKETTVQLSQERQSLLEELNKFKRLNEELTAERNTLQHETKMLQSQLSDKDLVISERDYEIDRLNEKIEQLTLREQTRVQTKQTQAQAQIPEQGTAWFKQQQQQQQQEPLLLQQFQNPQQAIIDNTISSVNATTNSIPMGTTTLDIAAGSDNIESWKRAAEVTRLLKVKIEKMRARNR